MLLEIVTALFALGPSGGGVPGLDVSDARHVRAVYLDLLGRTPDADELELARASRPETLVRFLVSSDEAWQQWYEDELQFFLLVDNFRPEDPPPRESLPARLARGELDVLAAVRGLVLSSAFHRANPGNDTFVSVVFEQLLGLVVQDDKALLEAGKRMYDGRRASLWGTSGDSQADVVAIACAQPAFVERFVARQYVRLVGRPPAPDVLARDVRALAEDPASFPSLVAGWLLSDDYASRLGTLRPKTDRQFVRGLYVDLAGRVPPEEDVRRFRRALGAVADAGPLRSVIAGVLLQREGPGLPPKGEIPADELVRDVMLRFLGRLPTPEEQEALVTAYSQSDAGPELLVRAVVTHWEYQYY